MSVEVRSRRGTTAEHNAFTGAAGEITVDTDKNVAVVHDGALAGGYPLAKNEDVVAVEGRVTSAEGRLDNLSDEEVITATGTQTLVEALDDRATKTSSDITVTVGSGADFATINEALTYLSNFYPEYKNAGVTATIELQAGFVMAEQVLVRGIDFGWVTITGVDAQTTITRSSLTNNFSGQDGYSFVSTPAFGVSRGGTLPRIGQLFQYDIKGNSSGQHGVSAVGAGSSVDILPSCGFVDAGVNIFAIAGAVINADGAIASSAGVYGIYATRGSTINANGAIASNAVLVGVLTEHSSVINAQGADASNAGSFGIHAKRASTINAEGADASNAENIGVYAEYASTINAEGADASNAGALGIFVTSGSTINAVTATGTTNITINTLTSDGIIFK